jgi:hypothetical protein
MNYKKWKPDNLIPNPQLNSIIVVNNASHNDMQVRSITFKEQEEMMSNLLNELNIPHCDDTLKLHLHILF